MEDEYPSDYVCPITMDLMLEPVKASDGYIYEKAAIIDWCKKNKNSPFTRDELTSEFILQTNLRDEIQTFINENNINIQKYQPKNKEKNNNPVRADMNDNPNSVGVSGSRNINNNQEILFSCSLCHNQARYNLGNRLLVCPFCSKVYGCVSCYNCYRYHLIEPINNGRFTCRYCNCNNRISNFFDNNLNNNVNSNNYNTNYNSNSNLRNIRNIRNISNLNNFNSRNYHTSYHNNSNDSCNIM